MSNSGKVWDTREAYQKQRANTWQTPGNRGMRLGGQTTPSGTNSNTVEYVDMISTGNTADFGDLTQARKKGAGAGGFTRILCLGGQTPTNVNTIDFVNPVATGNFADFGDLVNAGQTTNCSHSNNVKTISADGSGDDDGVVITHMASQGNSSTWQNRTAIDTQWASGTGDNTRFLMAGNYPASNQIDSMEIATLGAKADFGNLTRAGWGIATGSNSTRSVFMGGNVTPGTTNVIDFVTTQSAGNATDFGDLTASSFQDAAGASNSKTAIAFGYQVNTIDRINIATTGNATDFGDTLTSTFYQIMGADNGGGGLPQEGAFPQRASVNYMPGSGRALYNGGQTAPADALTTNVNMIHIPTTGNTAAFGDLATASSNGPGNGASTTRSIVYSGYSPASPYYNNTIQATTFSSLGNYFDFGDPTQQRYANCYGNIGSPTRAVFMGGYAPGSPYYVNIIDYVTIATVGNGTDFGDLLAATNNVAGCSSSTRGIGMGGYTGSQDDTIQYVTIASTGNATDFGNLAAAKSGAGGLSSSTRGIIGGGKAPSAINVIEYITIASTGNATDFGDLTEARNSIATASNSSRGVFMGGSTPSKVDKMDYITIASTGNATDFGDTKVDIREGAGTSDSHGGLQ
jgi:hypothetical protein